jgi:UDP-glucuronate decarboxylase
MSENDGRVVSNFIVQALTSKKITVFGDGSQTRSFCYVSDTVRGLMLLMNGNDIGPINIGNPSEFTVYALAKKITTLLGKSEADIEFQPLPQDDPTRRRPDISRAKNSLDWTPNVPVDEGLLQTIQYFRGALNLIKQQEGGRSA